MSTLQIWHPEALDVPQSPQRLVEESEALQTFINRGEDVGLIQNPQLPEMIIAATLGDEEKALIDGLSGTAQTPYSMQLKSHRSWLREGVTKQGHEVFSILRARGSRISTPIIRNLIVVEDVETGGEFLFGHSHREEINGKGIGVKQLDQIEVNEFYLLSTAAHRRSA